MKWEKIFIDTHTKLFLHLLSLSSLLAFHIPFMINLFIEIKNKFIMTLKLGKLNKFYTGCCNALIMFCSVNSSQQLSIKYSTELSCSYVWLRMGNEKYVDLLFFHLLVHPF